MITRMFVLVPVSCNEFGKLIVATCTKTHRYAYKSFLVVICWLLFNLFDKNKICLTVTAQDCIRSELNATYLT